MIKTLGELKRQIEDVIINSKADRMSEVLYYRQYTSDPLYVIEIKTIHIHEFEKDDEFGKKCHADEVPKKISKKFEKVKQ